MMTIFLQVEEMVHPWVGVVKVMDKWIMMMTLEILMIDDEKNNFAPPKSNVSKNTFIPYWESEHDGDAFMSQFEKKDFIEPRSKVGGIGENELSTMTRRRPAL